MSNTILKIDTPGLRRIGQTFRDLEKTFRTVTKDPSFLSSVGQLLAARGKQNLEDGGADVTSYTLLLPDTRREKSRKGYSLKPLQRTGLMRRSLSHKVEGEKLSLTGLRIVKHHQYGAPRAGIPKRPVFTVAQDDRNDIQDFLIRRFRKLNTEVL